MTVNFDIEDILDLAKKLARTIRQLNRSNFVIVGDRFIFSRLIAFTPEVLDYLDSKGIWYSGNVMTYVPKDNCDIPTILLYLLDNGFTIQYLLEF